jgi:glycosyltransferase involved in cell wall biosynthesis
VPRIAHVISTPAGVGGAERVVAALADAGARRGWEQIVLNPFARDPEKSKLASLCASATYAGHPCSGWAQVPGTRRWLKKALQEVSPAIVHAHLFHALVAVASIRLSAGPPYVATHHHGDHFSYQGRRSYELIDRYAGARFDRVVVASEWVREFLFARYHYPPDKVVRIPNGWSGHPLPRNEAAQPTIVCVANFRPQKGHETLLEAFSRVRARVPDARLVLVGGGVLEQSTQAHASRLGLQQAVEFVGAVPDVWPYLSEAHVFALASLYEPQGVAVIEAMAAGLPVVASAVGGIRETVQPGRTGELVPSGDAQALADQLVRLLSSPALREEMGSAARRSAADLKMDVTTERYLGLYEELLRG